MAIFKGPVPQASPQQKHTDERDKTADCGTLKKYLVSATDLFSRPTNIVSFSIVLWLPTSQ